MRAIYVMTTRVKNQATAAGAAAATPKAEVVVENTAAAVETTNDFSWDSLIGDSESAKTRDDIVRECLADTAHYRRVNNLHVKNVKAFARLAEQTGNVVTRLTFVTKEKVPGMVVDEDNLDAFGMPVRKIALSNNVFTSAYAVAGAMKEDAKGAIFADAVSSMTAVLAGRQEAEIVGTANIANLLFAGGTIDVICQFVKAGEVYVNPFASTAAEDTVFDEDRIFHHVVRCQFGPVGEDKYRALLLA